jgi:hypothetical protein
MSEESTGLLPSVPKGFKVAKEGDETLHVEYRQAGMGCSVVFLVVFLSFWTVPCVLLLVGVFSGPPLASLASCLFAIPCLAGEVLVAIILLWMFFGRMHFILMPDGLKVTKRLFTWSKTRVFPMGEITAFTQVKDGGGGEDSFPSWGLVVHAAKSVKIFSRQELKKSLWLGELLSKWSGKEFRTWSEQVIEPF